MSKTSNIWLGIDPGIARIGFGVLKNSNNNTIKVIDYGCITTHPHDAMENRLQTLYTELSRIIKKHRPTVMAVEKIYFAKNAKTALTVGHARGVILLAASTHGLSLKEFTPLEIKHGLTGYGRADKDQIGKMVKSILGLNSIPKPDDTADALAIALIAMNTKNLS